MSKIKVEVDVCRCKYCNGTAVIIDSYGFCPMGCSGNFKIETSMMIPLSPETVKRIRVESESKEE